MRLLCFFPRAACAYGNRCVPSWEHSQWSAVGPVPEERASRACRPPKRLGPVTRGPSRCSSCTCWLSARRTQANNPGLTGSTLVLVLAREASKEMQQWLQAQRGNVLVTHVRHTGIACGCTVKYALENASSLSAPYAVSDDARDGYAVRRSEAAGCWCTRANGRGRNSIRRSNGRSLAAALWRELVRDRTRPASDHGAYGLRRDGQRLCVRVH